MWTISYKRVNKKLRLLTLEKIKNKLGFNGGIGVVLGSGLGSIINHLNKKKSFKYQNIKSFPTSLVKGHRREFISGYHGTRQILFASGRFHYYEGFEHDKIISPIRVFNKLGVKNIIITNSCGSIRKKNKPGTLMLVDGHFDCTFKKNYLIPQLKNGDSYYSEKLISIALSQSKYCDIKLVSGKYCWTIGPQYETPEEIKFFKSFGGDVVGMSTIPEIEAAKKYKMNILVISLITNFAAGIKNKRLSHEEVLKNAGKSGKNFSKLLLKIIENID